MRNIFCIALLASAPVLAQGVPPVVGSDKWHKVEPGENMHKIARKYDVAIEHLAWANKLPMALAVEPGTKLRVPLRRILPAKPPANGLVVNLPERSAYLFRDGKFVDFYPVGIGMEQPAKFRTPTGLFKVTETLKNPDWHAPKWAKSKVKVVKSGNDKNPLGDRWIGTSADGIGFHATKDPVGVGDAKSHGCFRMATDDIHELFDKVRAGDVVRIDYQPFRLGVDKKTGQHVVAAFPDVYKKGATEQRAIDEMLGQAPMSRDKVDRSALQRVVKNATGVPVALTLKPVSQQVDPAERQEQAAAVNHGETARELGMQVGGEVMETSQSGVSEASAAAYATDVSDVSDAAGAKGAADATDASGAMDASTMTESADEPAAGRNVLLSARPLLDAFNIGYTYDESTGTVTIDDEAE